MYFNVNFNVFFTLIKVHFLVSELYMYQNARYNDKKTVPCSVQNFALFEHRFKCSFTIDIDTPLTK